MDTNRLAPHGADYARLVQSLTEMGLLTSPSPAMHKLAGGVSSLIVLVTDSGRKFCAKSALPKLKVAEDWYAPVHRNQAEVLWMQTARLHVPNAVPDILGQDSKRNIFAMEWLDPERHPVWKQRLLDGDVNQDVAKDLGRVLAQIHLATAGDANLASSFPNDADFDALRLDPYLRYTAKAHHDLAERLTSILETTANRRHAVIHGDVSPKNILVGPNGPIILDAECATYGDPAFDLAFCLHHLVLKAVHMPALAGALAASCQSMVYAYLPHVAWEPVADFQARTAALVPALALARVDGKSPLEYLSEPDRQRVREMTRPMIASSMPTLDGFLTNWMEHFS